MPSEGQIIPLNLLRTYSVEWDEETFVRDLWQNFYDASEDFRGVAFEEDAAARTARIRGSVPFALDHVKYIGGTTKAGGGYAGQFGEGFKICSLVAIRDFKLAFRAGAGRWRIEAAFEPRAVGEELVYRYSEAEDCGGSFVELVGCSERLRAALQRGRRFFRWKGSASLGACLFEDGTAFVYRCTRPKGEIYYCKQLRAETSATVPLAFCFDREIEGIRRDRDRRNLTKPQLQKVVRAIAERVTPEAAAAIVEAMKPAWEVGSPALEAFVEGLTSPRAVAHGRLSMAFPPDWVARERYRSQWHYANDEAGRMNLRLGIEELARVGMRPAREAVTATTAFVAESERRPIDRARRAVLLDAGGLSYKGTFRPVRFARITTAAGIATPSEIHLEYGLLAGPFAEALATYLHEFCHEHGRDGTSAFSDALTDAIGGVAERARWIAELRECWDVAARIEPEVLRRIGATDDRQAIVRELMDRRKP